MDIIKYSLETTKRPVGRGSQWLAAASVDLGVGLWIGCLSVRSFITFGPISSGWGAPGGHGHRTWLPELRTVVDFSCLWPKRIPESGMEWRGIHSLSSPVVAEALEELLAWAGLTLERMSVGQLVSTWGRGEMRGLGERVWTQVILGLSLSTPSKWWSSNIVSCLSPCPQHAAQHLEQGFSVNAFLNLRIGVICLLWRR